MCTEIEGAAWGPPSVVARKKSCCNGACPPILTFSLRNGSKPIVTSTKLQGDKHPFTSNFGVHQGAKVLAHRHLEMLLEIWESNEISL